jgi:gas vesicle protein
MGKNKKQFNSNHNAETANPGRAALAGLWLVVGLGIGALMTLFYAPSSGKKMRRKLSKRVGNGFSGKHNAFEPVINRIEKEVDELRDTLEDHIPKFR